MTAQTEDIPESVDQMQTRRSRESGDHLRGVALRTYCGHTRRPIKDDEVLELLPMVHSIARRTVSYIRPPLSFEDLISAGTVGLLKAARSFDASRQVEFKTYAYIRIKGAILDELRRASLLPSAVNRQVRRAQELSQHICEQTGTPPADEDLARRLDISIDELYDLYETARTEHFLSIDDASDQQPALGQALAAADSDSPDSRMEKAELVEKLTQAMGGLDERRLQIIILYYHKHLTMKQIADLMEITESRVSQLHASALFNLSVKLGQWKDD